MPIYEYKCEKCGNEFEQLVFGQECPSCPKCESDKVCRLMSCCQFKSATPIGQPPASSSSSSSSCGGCSATSCAGCGH